MFTAPFHKVGFADFWLADQLNSLAVILMDLEYMICFYSIELQWGSKNALLAPGKYNNCFLYIVLHVVEKRELFHLNLSHHGFSRHLEITIGS